MLLVAVALSLSVGSSASLYNTAVSAGSFTGSRTAPSSGGITEVGNYDNISLSWTILPETASLYRYTYTFANFVPPAISHFILELSDNCTATGECFRSTSSNIEFGTFGPQASNPNFPAGQSIKGVKFEFGSATPAIYTFLSNRIPVWGNFYIKGGSNNDTGNNFGRAYNNALALSGFNSEIVTDFIARPDTIRIPSNETGIPEPATYALIGSALVIVAMLRRRKS